MRFWDSSALVPLVLEEPASAACRALLKADRAVAAWALSRIEILSALRRKERAKEIDATRMKTALRRVDLLQASWTEIDSLPAVCDRAERLLAVHTLRAADALQLAAALVLVEDRPRNWSFVTTDARLFDAASAEGFSVELPAR